MNKLPLFIVCAIAVPAANAASPVSRISVAPKRIELVGSRAQQQLLSTGHFSDRTEEFDLTREARYESRSPNIAVVTSDGLVLPRGFGTAEIVARFNGFEASTAVTVRDFGSADPIDFNTDVLAALSRAGCNSGACHGSPQGKNGFRLSLRGFDPALDHITLARESFGRRTNPQAPDESLILRKGLGQIPHQGGIRFRSTDTT
ncbi:MAG: S-layer protein, partial [Planctomycetota bacterium]|nr:S-layer protein [Planctomycetota bacterium]